MGVGLFIIDAQSDIQDKIIKKYKDFATALPQRIEGIQVRVLGINEFTNLNCQDLKSLVDFDLAE